MRPSRKSRQAEATPTLRRHPIGPQTGLFALALTRENDETITQMKKAEGRAAARTFRHRFNAAALLAAGRFVAASVDRTAVIGAAARRGRRRCPDLQVQSPGLAGRRRRGADLRCRGLRTGTAIIGAAAIIGLRRGGLAAAV